MSSSTPVPSLNTILTEEALCQLLEPVRDSVEHEERLCSLYIGPARTHQSVTPCSIPTTRGDPSTSMGLYTPTRSRASTPAPDLFIPKQYEREGSILSTDPDFDPNDHWHNPLLDPRYLAFVLWSVYQRVWDPTPNFPSQIVIPVERLIYLPWFEHPDPVVHLEDCIVQCNEQEVSVHVTPFHADHEGCILGFSPTVADLFPSGFGDIFSMFFLKEDMCYPWLRSAGLQVARNKTRFRNVWLRGEIDFGVQFPGKFFRSLLSIQQKFAKLVIDITNYVVNPAARKVAVCNQEVLASYLALGVDEHGDWILGQDFLAIFYRCPRPQYTQCLWKLPYLTFEMRMNTFPLFNSRNLFIVSLILLLFRHFYSFVPPRVLRIQLNFDSPPTYLLYKYRLRFKLPAM